MKIMSIVACAALVAASAAASEEGAMQGDHGAGPATSEAGHHAGGTDAALHGLEMAASRTVKGEIIDITCYLRHQASGKEHIGCAVMCANMGMPLGVLEDGSAQIYLIIPTGHADPKAGVLEHLGKHVEVQGTVLALGGMATLEIKEVKEL